jgi:hypothetical protein
MDVNRPHGLTGMLVLAVGIGERVLIEKGLGRHGAVWFQPENRQAVLPLQRDIDEPSIGVEIQMARAKAHAVAPWGDGLKVGKLAVLEAEDFDMSRVFRLGRSGVIAAAAQGHSPVARRGAGLMGIDAKVRLACLRHVLADGAVGFQPVHGDMAGDVVGDQQERAGMIGGNVQRPYRQQAPGAMLGQAAVGGDPVCDGIVLLVAAGCACRARGRLAVAGRDIEELFGRMRPGILHIGGQGDPAAQASAWRLPHPGS